MDQGCEPQIGAPVLAWIVLMVIGRRWPMDERRAAAERLLRAERELREAQRTYDGSDPSRIRYGRARNEMVAAQAEVERVLADLQARDRAA